MTDRTESFYGGRKNAERVKAICVRSRLILEAGVAALAEKEKPLSMCNCFWPGGRAKYMQGSKPVHRCGR